MLTIITAILAVGVIAGVAWVYYRSDQLDEREEELSKRSAYLDERANKLAQWEKELNQYDLKK